MNPVTVQSLRLRRSAVRLARAVVVIFAVAILLVNLLMINYEKARSLDALGAISFRAAEAMQSRTDIAVTHLRQMQQGYADYALDDRFPAAELPSPMLERFALPDTQEPFASATKEFRERYASVFLKTGSTFDAKVRYAVSLSPMMRSAHLVHPQFEWSYFYDAARTVFVVYPATTSEAFTKSTGTTNIDQALVKLYDADGTDPITLIGPKLNPERGLKWTRPYMDAMGAGMMVTLLAPLYKGDEFVGACGTDLTFAMWNSSLRELNDPRVAMFLVTPQNEAVGCSDPSRVLSPEWLDHEGPHGQFSRKGFTYVQTSQLQSNGWRLISVVGSASLLSSMAPNVLIFSAGSLVIMCALLWLLYVFHRRLAQPAVALVEHIENITGDRPQPHGFHGPVHWRECFEHLDKVSRERREYLQSTLEKAAELARQKALLQAQFDATQDGILVGSSSGRIITWNRRFVEIWKMPNEILLSGDDTRSIEHVAGQMQDPEEFKAKVGSLYASADASQTDTLQLRDGRILLRFTTPLRGEDGQNYGRIWFFSDITERERAQADKQRLMQQLNQSQKMEAVGLLAGGVAHDFNNALTTILSAADLALMDDIPEAERREFISMIISAARPAGALTKKLLTFSRKGTKAMAVLDAAAVVEDTAGLLRHTIDKHNQISVQNLAKSSLILGDDCLLQNALMNMGINASHAMPKGGKLSFILKNVNLDEEYCEASPFKITPGEYLEIAVWDTGQGIRPEILGRLFEPFFTTKPEGQGTGLGLAAVYGTVLDHHGAVTVYSELGKGTVFRIYLPLSTGGVSVVERRELLPPAGIGTILVIDDEELIRTTLHAMLTKWGYTVLLASNGQEGLELFKGNREAINLVILDMIMPTLGGRETFLRLRDLEPGLPVILSSGFSKEEDMQVIKDQGISGFLHKPFGRVSLLESLNEVFPDGRGPAESGSGPAQST